MAHTLTSSQILLIKQAIAVWDKRLVIDIEDSEAFDYVSDMQNAMNNGLHNKSLRYISWSRAVEYCYDDFGAAEMLGFY